MTPLTARRRLLLSGVALALITAGPARAKPEQAAFAVLKSPTVPSVLVETSFITNPAEERRLGTTAFRQKFASAIVEGIVSYFNAFDAHNRRPGR